MPKIEGSIYSSKVVYLLIKSSDILWNIFNRKRGIFPGIFAMKIANRQALAKNESGESVSIILIILMIVACLLLLAASSQPHMLSPEHPNIRRPTEEKSK